MNAQVPATRTAAPKPQMLAGGQVAALVPQTLDEAFRVATAIAASGLAPKGVDTTEKVLVAMMAGAELGFAPFQAMQSFAVINGKPNIWGDALPALLWSRGFELDEWFDNDDQPTKAFCRITRPGGKTIERSFSVAQARQAGLTGKQGPWQQYQSRMLQMRARAFAARDGASDVLRGMQVAEEVQDYQPMTARHVPAEGPNLAARLNAPKEGPNEGFTSVHSSAPGDDDIPDFDADAEQTADVDTNFPGDTPPTAEEETAAGSAEASADEGTGPAAELLEWASRLKEDIEGLTLEQIDVILASDNEVANFAALEATQPQIALDLNKTITRRRKELGA